jgi:hypothetical protein
MRLLREHLLALAFILGLAISNSIDTTNTINSDPAHSVVEVAQQKESK